MQSGECREVPLFFLPISFPFFFSPFRKSRAGQEGDIENVMPAPQSSSPFSSFPILFLLSLLRARSEMSGIGSSFLPPFPPPSGKHCPRRAYPSPPPFFFFPPPPKQRVGKEIEGTEKKHLSLSPSLFPPLSPLSRRNRCRRRSRPGCRRRSSSSLFLFLSLSPPPIQVLTETVAAGRLLFLFFFFPLFF